MKKVTPESNSWRAWPLTRLEREYSPSSCVPSSAPFLAAYGERSRQAVEHLPCQRNLHWGNGEDETFDFFPVTDNDAGNDAPLLIFIHGGYWQELSKNDSLFLAPNCVARGIAYAAIEYTLAPRATVVAIVDQCRRAIVSIAKQAQALGFDSRRIFVAGSSAGAHLAAMLLVQSGEAIEEFSRGVIAGAVLLSGIYDLAPIVPTYINEALRLTEDEAANLSPQRLRPGAPVPVVVAWGENETPEFKRQSESFAAKLKDAGFDVKSLQITGANHFDIVFEIADSRTVLGQATLNLINT